MLAGVAYGPAFHLLMEVVDDPNILLVIALVTGVVEFWLFRSDAKQQEQPARER